MQLIVFSFVLAYVRLSDAWFHSVGAPTRLGINAQRPAVTEAEPTGRPDGEHSSQSAQQVAKLQSKQNQLAAEPLSWKFPEDPVDLVTKPPFKFELRQPVVADPVAVRCGESKIFVEVSQDLLGLGKLIKPEEITLGGCSATEIDDLSHVLVFESELHGCGSTLVLTESTFIYAFMLVYNPKEFGRNGITRSQSAVIGVECHYQSASSHPEPPAWTFNKDTGKAGAQHYFSLKLMTDDWRFERTSNKYASVDVINMEAAVLLQTQPPLRVLVDSCVATTEPNSASEPREALIKNNGCLGGQHTISRFMPQSQPDKLQLLVAAHSLGLQGMVYISCLLKAISASTPVTIENKACSFYEGIWRAVDGKDQFCTCCESTCGMRKIRDLHANAIGNACLQEKKNPKFLAVGILKKSATNSPPKSAY
uniref:Zona pellucida sperm-binding protein 3 n=1 Tax=Amphilophus citrinellus TaxID=61819 RepID=A0A3Q0S1F4_AMPCI